MKAKVKVRPAMKVWLAYVTWEYNDGGRVLGVFSTRRKGQAALNAYRDGYHGRFVRPFTLNAKQSILI